MAWVIISLHASSAQYIVNITVLQLLRLVNRLIVAKLLASQEVNENSCSMKFSQNWIQNNSLQAFIHQNTPSLCYTYACIHWRELVKNIVGANQNFGEQNLIKSKKCMGDSQILGGAQAAPQSIRLCLYVYVISVGPYTHSLFCFPWATQGKAMPDVIITHLDFHVYHSLRAV